LSAHMARSLAKSARAVHDSTTKKAAAAAMSLIVCACC
jgi:hypothetical protein